MMQRSPTQTKAESSFTPVQTGLLQRKCASCGQHPLAGGECTESQSERSPLQRRSTNQAEPSEVPSIAHEVLRSPGQPLDAGTRNFMESRFKHDFSQVRVHTDAKAAESAQAVNAIAYTVGQDVVFGAGQYAPTTPSGQRLLAHELTHVIQQHSHPGFQRKVLQRRGGTIGGFFSNLGRSIVEFFGGTIGFSQETLQKYLKTLDDTNKIENDFDSDDKARAIVNAWRLGGSPYILTAPRKALLIQEIQAGFTGDDDEQAILEILERSYNFELSYIFGTGGVNVKSLNSDFHGDEWERLKDFYERRFENGMDAMLQGKIKPKGLPVPFGQALPIFGSWLVEDLPGARQTWNVACVLEILCLEDKAVVEQLPNLKVQKANRVIEVYWEYDGNSWIMKNRERAAFSNAKQRLIGLKANADCATAAKNIIHEVRHQNQPADWSPAKPEIDAYTFEEEWAIKRGLPGRSSFRTTKPGTQEEVPNVAAIEKYVEKRYSGVATTPGEKVIGHTPAGEARVLRPDDSEYTRPAQKGESHQDYEKTKANLDNLPQVKPSEWVCPRTK